MQFIKKLTQIVRGGGPEGEIEAKIHQNPRILVMGTYPTGADKITRRIEEALKKRGLENRVDVNFLRDVAHINEAILGSSSGGPDNPVSGVVLLSEMRQYSSGGVGMTIDTNESGIRGNVERLCNKLGIPLAIIPKGSGQEEISEGVIGLLD